MAGKIRAACDARASDETLIIGRTDAIAVEGFDAALDAPRPMSRPAPTCCSSRRRNRFDEIQQIVARFAGACR
jgi:hypothetical protein